MSNFVIEIFAKIIGVGAASGICFHANDIKIVSDNSNYLYSYNLSSSSLQKTLIYDNGVNNEIVEKKN